MARGLVFAGLAPGGLVGSTHYHDSSLYGNHGTLKNFIPGWKFDPYLGRFCTDQPGSSDSHVSIPDAPHLNFNNGFTVSLWCKLNNPTAVYNAIIAKGTYGASVNFCTILNSSSGMATRIYSGSGVYKSWSIAHDTNWHHIAATISNNVTLYYDGISQGEQKQGQTTGTNTNPIQIGCASVSYETNGLFADVLIYNHVCEEFIQQLADPSNVMLSGLILPPRRTLFSVSTLSIAEEYIYRKINYYRRLRSS